MSVEFDRHTPVTASDVRDPLTITVDCEWGYAGCTGADDAGWMMARDGGWMCPACDRQSSIEAADTLRYA